MRTQITITGIIVYEQARRRHNRSEPNGNSNRVDLTLLLAKTAERQINERMNERLDASPLTLFFVKVFIILNKWLLRMIFSILEYCNLIINIFLAIILDFDHYY